MYKKLLNFIKYNNAFTIILGMFFLGFGVSFASPAVRESVYASEETLAATDNSAIISVDLDNFAFNLVISAVTEDEKNYYATYSYQTLAVLDGIWQNQEMEKVLTISREALEGRDLGLYVAEELGENLNYELSYLKKVQKLEKERGESQKVIAVEYSGLVGGLLDPREMVIEGYDPVIPEIIPEEEVIVSTPYAETVETAELEPVEPSEEPAAESTPPQAELETEPVLPEETADPMPTEPEPTPETVLPPIESEPEPESESVPEADLSAPVDSEVDNEIETPAEDPETLPAPEDMVDEELIQEVVEELLETPS